MRNAPVSWLVLGVLACSSDMTVYPGSFHHPPLPTVIAGNRVIADAGGVPVIEGFASIKNETAEHVLLVMCPLQVRLYWDPLGQHPGGVNASMACPSGSPTLDMAPGDSTVRTQVFPADSLAAYRAGQYAVEVVLTAGSIVSGIPAGEVTLPLTPP